MLQKETVRKRKDGSLVDVSSLGYPIRFGDKTVGVYVIYNDITERKRMWEMLGRSVENFRRSLDESPLGVRIFVPDGVTVYANHVFLDLFGCDSVEEFNAIPHEKHYAPESYAVYEQRREERKRGGFVPSPYESSIVRKNGEIRHLQVFRKEVLWNGKMHFQHLFRDITEGKRREAEMRDLERKAQIASRLASVGEMAAGIAHEINNPLTPVVGFSELLLQRELPEDVKSDLQIIHDGASRAADVVKRLLTFARQYKPQRTLCNINEVVESALQLMAYRLKTNGISVTTELDPALPQTMADAGQLQQVLLNLVTNAEYEMRQAHGGGNLLVRTEKMNDFIRLSVRDDGPGISKENMEKLFQPFFTTKEVGQGTGLGLSVCHGIVAEHNGRIYAESAVGKGAAFIVEIPVVGQTRQEAAKLSEPDSGESGEAVNARILVVDDEPTITKILSRVLTDEGYEVKTTGRAREAINLIEGGQYGLILLDIKLPDMSGIDLYRHLEETDKSLTRRIIFITGDVLGTGTMDFFARTGASYINKPFNIERVKEMVKSKLTQTG